MKYAANYRADARNALAGKWKTAVVAGLVASLLGGVTEGVRFDTSDINFHVDPDSLKESFTSLTPQWNPQILGFMAGFAVIAAAIALVFAVAYFIVSSVAQVGYAQFNLDLIDRKEAQISTVVSRFPQWKKLTVANLLRGLYVFLWTLLFIIPGIVASYSYAMTGYILAEHPELTAKEAIARSKQMMEGNRIRLFCLEISFIGWAFLCALTLGIGYLWLTPYTQAAKAAFYREVSGTEIVEMPEEAPALEETSAEE